VHRAPERYLGAPPPDHFRVCEAKSKTRAQKRAAGTKKHVLFDK
jgi:hypothetical protein